MRSLAATLALLAASAASSAAEVTDTDGDGSYSYEELVAGYPGLDEATFELIDADASGAVDEVELIAAQESGLLDG